MKTVQDSVGRDIKKVVLDELIDRRTFRMKYDVAIVSSS